MCAQVDLFDAGSGRALGSLGSEFMTAIPSRTVAHPSLPAIAACSASGRVHIFQ